MVLPPEQVAVAGNIQEGLNLAMAFAENLEEGSSLVFYNLPALLRFQLSGSASNEVKEVRFTAPTAIAEGAAFYMDEEGMPVRYPNYFVGDSPSNTVTLKGSFEEGQEYYIALWPKELAGFEMTFSDSNGNVVTPVNNAFGTKWGASSYGDMRADDARVFNFVSANCPDIVSGVHSINEVPIVLIVNDARYAGRAWLWNTGRSYCMIPFSYSGGNIVWIYPKLTATSETDPAGGCHETTPEEYAVMGRYSPGDLSSFSFDSWLEKDVTIDPVRDLPTRSEWTFDPPVAPTAYPAPPGFVEE